MITIAVDAMGGDHAPRPEVEGSVLAVRELGVRVLLVGQPNVVRVHGAAWTGGGDITRVELTTDGDCGSSNGTRPPQRVNKRWSHARLIHGGKRNRSSATPIAALT